MPAVVTIAEPGVYGTGFRSDDGPLPANTCVALLATYPAVKLIVLVSCLCMVAFQASSVGRRWNVGRILGCTLPSGPPNGKMPSDGITGNANAGGPCANVKAFQKVLFRPGSRPLFPVLVLGNTC